MKRVLFLQSQTYFGADSAIQAQLMRHYDRREVEVHVACNRRDDLTPSMTALPRIQAIPNLFLRETEFGPSVFGQSFMERIKRTFTQAPLALAHLIGLALYIKRHKIDIIHGTEKPRDAFYGVLLGKLTGAKSVVHLHVRHAEWLHPNVKWALNNADAVVGVSRFVAQTAIEAGVPAAKVHAVVNALDIASGEWNPTYDNLATRAEFGLTPDHLVIGVCSRLFRWKGHTELIAAFSKIADELPNARLMIVGEDDSRANPGGGSFYNELMELVGSLSLADRVVFTGFRADAARLMAAFDIYAMPSFEEPLGMVYLEAMALQVPVVGYLSGGVPEVVCNETSGLLTPAYDVDALANSLRKLAVNPALRRRLGAAGRARVLREFTSPTMCSRMQSVYDAVLTGRREFDPTSAIHWDSLARVGESA